MLDDLGLWREMAFECNDFYFYFFVWFAIALNWTWFGGSGGDGLGWTWWSSRSSKLMILWFLWNNTNPVVFAKEYGKKISTFTEASRQQKDDGVFVQIWRQRSFKSNLHWKHIPFLSSLSRDQQQSQGTQPSVGWRSEHGSDTSTRQLSQDIALRESAHVIGI